MTRILRTTLFAALLTTVSFAFAAGPGVAPACVNVLDPEDCIPCLDGGEGCPTVCDGQPLNCVPCWPDVVEECVPVICGGNALDCVPCWDEIGSCVPCFDDFDACVPCDDGDACEQLRNQLPRNPTVVNNGDGTFTVRYTQCNASGANCQARNLTTTPNGFSAGVPATSSPDVPARDVGTPPVDRVCAPNGVVCVGPVAPVPVGTVPGVGPILIVPASNVAVAVEEIGVDEPGVETTSVGPVQVTPDPVPVTVCDTPCPVPSGVSGGPRVRATVVVHVGAESWTIALP